MGEPKTVVYCSKCGNGILVGKMPDEPIKVPPCRHCRRQYTQEAFIAGRASAMADLFKEKE